MTNIERLDEPSKTVKAFLARIGSLGSKLALSSFSLLLVSPSMAIN